MNDIELNDIYLDIRSHNYTFKNRKLFINGPIINELMIKNNLDIRDIDLLKILVGIGADINFENQFRENTFGVIGRFPDEKSTEMMRYMLDLNPSEHSIIAAIVECIKSRIIMGEQYLDEVNQECIEVVDTLIAKIENINIQINDNGGLIHLCCSVYYPAFKYLPALDILKLLLERGADIGLKNRYNKTVFDILREKFGENISKSVYMSIFTSDV